MFISHYSEMVEIANVEISKGQNSERSNVEGSKYRIPK